jgi:tetratricopeptide (TPR) repeat protein
MRMPLSLLDAERPDPPGADHVPRGETASLAIEDVKRDGVAVLQGPAGSGTTSIAAAAAAQWVGPVAWKRPGLFVHLADIARPLWPEEAPSALQQAPVDDAVSAIIERLSATRTLWVLDDFDDALEPPPGPAVPRDPDVGVLFAALESRALAGSGAGVLVVSRRTPRGLSTPSRPVPPLSLDAAAILAGRDVSGLDPAWRRRPAALVLLPSLPPGVSAPVAGAAPFDELLEAIANTLDETTSTVLLAAAMAVHPVGLIALFSATGLPRDHVARAIATLTNLRLLVIQGAGRRCPRHVAEAAVTVLPDRLPGVLRDPLLGRLSAFHLRQGDGAGRGWTSADPAITSRLSLRLSARAGYPQMAVNTALYAGHVAVMERFGAWRHLRDDLGIGLARRTDDLSPQDEARARLARAMAAARVQDHAVVDYELPRAVGPARKSGDGELLRSIHTRLAGRILLAGDPNDAIPHLHEALALARRAGDKAGQSDLFATLAGVSLHQGEIEAADRHFRHAREAAEDAQDPRRAARASAGLGGVAMGRGELRKAELLLQAAADAARDLDDAVGEASRRGNVALVRAQRGDQRGAMKAIRQGMAVDVDHPRSRARLLCLRAELRRLAGDIAGAHADLDAAHPAVQSGGDRGLVAELRAGRAACLFVQGNWDEAVQSHIDATRALGRSVQPAERAASELARWNVEGWRAAAALLEGDRDALSTVLDAARRTTALLATVAESPLRPRRIAAELRSHETALLAATVAGTAPMGALRRLEALHVDAAADPERIDDGEPAIRTAWTWALRLCRAHDKADKAARRAALDAGLASLATVRGQALVFAGRIDELPAWHAPALLLAEFFPPR